MPQIAPPPYQSIAGSLQWHAWYRQINDLLERVSVSINAHDDVTITSVTDNELLSWDSGTSKWINQTLTELGIVLDTSPQLGGDLDMNGFDITAPLNLTAVGNPNLILNETGDTGSTTEVIEGGAGSGNFRQTHDDGASTVSFDALAEASSASTFRFNRTTNTSGNVRVELYRGNNSGTIDHLFISGSSGTLGGVCLNGGNFGIGTSSPDGTLHAHTATAGAVAASSVADDMIVENSADGGISILTPDLNIGYLMFGSPTDNTGARVSYSYNSRVMSFGTSVASGALQLRSGDNTLALSIDASQDVHIGGTSPSARLHVTDTSTLLGYLETTNADAGGGPLFRLYKNSATPADADLGGNIQWRGNTDDGAGGVTTLDFLYADNLVTFTETGDGSEKALFQIRTKQGDGYLARISAGRGVALGAESDPGTNGHLNAAAYEMGGNRIHGATTAVTGATHTHAATNRYLLCDTTSNAITVNLLAAATAGSGARLDVKIVNATNAVTIDGSGSETIDGGTTLVLTTLYDNASLVCDGSNWHIL